MRNHCVLFFVLNPSLNCIFQTRTNIIYSLIPIFYGKIKYPKIIILFEY